MNYIFYGVNIKYLIPFIVFNLMQAGQSSKWSFPLITHSSQTEIKCIYCCLHWSEFVLIHFSDESQKAQFSDYQSYKVVDLLLFNFGG